MFNPVFVKAYDLDELWFNLLNSNYENGRRYKITSGSYAGAERVEFDFVSGWVENPHNRPLAPIVPVGIPVPTTDDAIVNYFSSYIIDSVLFPNEEYRYSTWINGKVLDYPEYCNYIKCKYLKDKPFLKSKSQKSDTFESIFYKEILNCCTYQDSLINTKDFKCPLISSKPNSQLDWVINHFKTAGYGNNHCYINVGDKESSLAYDRAYVNETDRGTSPCLRGIDFKIKDNKLITSVVFRSWDLYSGLPENLGGITLLNEYVCEFLDGISPGPLAFSCSGLHCYDFQLEYRNMRIKK